jgi:hypothetical protein
MKLAGRRKRITVSSALLPLPVTPKKCSIE